MAKPRKMAGATSGQIAPPELITSPEKRTRVEIAADVLERWGYEVDAALYPEAMHQSIALVGGLRSVCGGQSEPTVLHVR
jgi:hypothetical protein